MMAEVDMFLSIQQNRKIFITHMMVSSHLRQRSKSLTFLNPKLINVVLLSSNKVLIATDPLASEGHNLKVEILAREASVFNILHI